jgi:CBS-domain-containing membrane protein
VVGVVSEADLLAADDGDPEHAGRLTADRLMTAPAVCVHPESPIALAARLMARGHLKRLPVVDGEQQLVGVVSRGDLLKVHLRADEELVEQVRFELLAVLRPDQAAAVDIQAQEAVVTLSGTLADPSTVPLLERIVRAVPGVVDVRTSLVAVL